MTAEDIRQVNILGTRIAELDMQAAVQLVLGWLGAKAKGHYVCATGVHGLMEGVRHSVVRAAHNHASVCVADGVPLAWFSRMRGHRSIGRVYGPDLMLRLLQASTEKGYTQFFYGGAAGVAHDLRARMEDRFAGLKVVGTCCPPFRELNEKEERDLTNRVSKLAPDIFWVGLSTPKQELFMHRMHEKLDAGVMVGVGAAFDFHTGRVRQAPRWMQKTGMEWFFRLCAEPRRLAGRYFRNNPAFVMHSLLQLTGLRKYPVG